MPGGVEGSSDRESSVGIAEWIPNFLWLSREERFVFLRMKNLWLRYGERWGIMGRIYKDMLGFWLAGGRQGASRAAGIFVGWFPFGIDSCG